MMKALSPVLAALGTILTITTVSLAADEYDVTAQGSDIMVTAKNHFHVNKEFPWAVLQADKKLDKKFEFQGESAAKVSGLGKGKYTVKGAVCNGPQCMPFKADVEVK
jgi:hypothetical protein